MAPGTENLIDIWNAQVENVSTDYFHFVSIIFALFELIFEIIEK